MIYNGKEYKKTDPEFYAIIGKMSDQKQREALGEEGYRAKKSEAGRRGGNVVKQKYGLEHYSKLGQWNRGDRR